MPCDTAGVVNVSATGTATNIARLVMAGASPGSVERLEGPLSSSPCSPRPSPPTQTLDRHGRCRRPGNVHPVLGFVYDPQGSGARNPGLLHRLKLASAGIERGAWALAAVTCSFRKGQSST